jgi:hypothetical protein
MEPINVFEVLSSEDSKTIANLVWKLLDKEGIETSEDAALQIEVYDEED